MAPGGFGGHVDGATTGPKTVSAGRSKPNEQEPHMKRIALLAALAFATPALAADVTPESELGTSMAEVTASLVGMGYEVRKAEMEDGKIEVYFVRGKQMGEVYVDAETGKVAKLELK